MRTDSARSLWFGFVIATAVGCATERGRLEGEQARLREQRQFLQEQLDKHPAGTKWATQPDSMRLVDTQGRLDQEIGDID